MSPIVVPVLDDCNTLNLSSPLELAELFDRGERAADEYKRQPQLLHEREAFASFVFAAWATVYRPAASQHNAPALLEA